MRKFLPLLLFSFLIISSFIAVFNSISATTLIEDSWNMKTPVPHERANFRVVTVDNKIYAIGGSYQVEVPSYDQIPLFVTHYLGTNEQYDPVTDSWVILKSMPTPREYFAIAAYDGKIYCIGGRTDGVFNYCMINEVYDTITDSWSTKASLPDIEEHNIAIQAHTVNGKIFVRTLYALFMYDPVKDSWIKRTQVPYNTEPRSAIVSAVVDDNITVFQVVESDYPRDQPNKVNVMVYDTKTDKWKEGRTQEIGVDFIFAAEATTGVYAPKVVYVLGGRFSSSPIGLYIWCYDSVTDIWSTSKAVPIYIGVYGVTVVDDVVYMFGTNENGKEGKTLQYVPIGYRSTAYTTHAPSNSWSSETFPSDSSKTALTYIVLAVLTLTIGTATVSLFTYFKKRYITEDRNG